MLDDQQRFKVIIGGSGPAAIEAALVLRRLAGALVETTIVTPDDECVHLPMTVLDPVRPVRRHPLSAGRSGGGCGRDPAARDIVSVDPAAREVRTGGGDRSRTTRC